MILYSVAHTVIGIAVCYAITLPRATIIQLEYYSRVFQKEQHDLPVPIRTTAVTKLGSLTGISMGAAAHRPFSETAFADGLLHIPYLGLQSCPQYALPEPL